MEPDFSLAATRDYRFVNGVIPAKGSHRGVEYPRNIMVFVSHNGRIYRQVITGNAVNWDSETCETRVCHKHSTLDGLTRVARRRFPDYWVVWFDTLTEYFEMDGRCRIAGSLYAPKMCEAIARAVIV